MLVYTENRIVNKIKSVKITKKGKHSILLNKQKFIVNSFFFNGE